MMRRVPAQGELPLKRARALPIDDTDVVTLRVPTDVADAVNADPEAAAHKLAREALRMTEELVGYTNWRSDGTVPPFSGFWDLKVRGEFKASTATHRVWFDKDKDVWHIGEGLIPASTVLADFVWRGLAAPWPTGYTYRVPGRRVMQLEN